MLTNEQLAERYNKDTRVAYASDVATILGVNPYQTAYELWLQYMGEAPEGNGDNDNTYWGNLLEEPIGQRWAAETGKKIQRKEQAITNKKYPWLNGHLDYLIVGEREPLECKNVGWFLRGLWGENETDEVAEYYLPQIMTYVGLRGNDLGHCAALIGGNDFRRYEIEYDKELFEVITETTHDFIFENVAKEIPPDIDYEHKSILQLLKSYYKGVNKGAQIDLGDDIQSWVNVKADAAAKVKEYQSVVDVAQAHLLEAMGENEIGFLPDGSAIKRSTIKVKESSRVVPAYSYNKLAITKKPPARNSEAA